MDIINNISNFIRLEGLSNFIAIISFLFSVIIGIITIINNYKQKKIQNIPELLIPEYNYQISWPKKEISIKITDNESKQSEIQIINMKTNTAYEVELFIDRSPLKVLAKRVQKYNKNWSPQICTESKFIKIAHYSWAFIPPAFVENATPAKFYFPEDLLKTYAEWIMEMAENNPNHTFIQEDILLAKFRIMYRNSAKKKYSSTFFVHLFTNGGDHLSGSDPTETGNDSGRIRFVKKH